MAIRTGDRKVPRTRGQECPRYVAQAFQPAGSGDFPVARPHPHLTTPVRSQPTAQPISKPNSERISAVLDQLKLEITPIGNSNGELRFSFSLENNGPKRLFVDPLKLKISRGASEVKAEAQSSDGRLILEPGKVMVGIIRLPQGVGPLKLEWPVRAFGMTSEVRLTAVIP